MLESALPTAFAFAPQAAVAALSTVEVVAVDPREDAGMEDTATAARGACSIPEVADPIVDPGSRAAVDPEEAEDAEGNVAVVLLGSTVVDSEDTPESHPILDDKDNRTDGMDILDAVAVAVADADADADDAVGTFHWMHWPGSDADAVAEHRCSTMVSAPSLRATDDLVHLPPPLAKHQDCHRRSIAKLR